MRVSRGVKILASLLLAAAPLRAQCGPPDDEPAPPVRDSLLVSTAWLAAHLQDTNVVIIHVDHMTDAYGRGHIPGARHLDAMAFTTGNFDLPPLARIDSVAGSLGIGPASRVVIYGDPWVTGMVFVALDQLGHGNRTAMLDGGLDAWKAEGRAVTTAVPAVARRSNPEHPQAVVVDAAWVRAHQRDDHVAILDVRTPEEYSGPGRDANHAGHVAGARNVPWSDVFVQPRDAEQSKGSKLRPVAELRDLFRRAGVRGGITPVVYCTVGMRASQMYFVLRYLGYDPKFYDGSIMDWNSHPGYSVVTGTARGTP